MLSAQLKCGAPPTATNETPGAPDQATPAQADTRTIKIVYSDKNFKR